MHPASLPQVDYGATSVRPTFSSLPPEVQVACGDAVGSAVVAAAPPVGSGFTGAFAGLLHLADGRRVFAKAAGPTMPHVVRGLADEERILPLIAHLRCTSRLAGAAEVPTADGLWRVLVLDAIDGRQPGAPWSTVDADAAAAACLEVATVPSGVAATVTTSTLASDLGGDVEALEALEALAGGTRAWPSELPSLDEQGLADLAALSRRAERALEGEALVHADTRPDNLLIEPTGAARIVDWNHATLGTPWVDLVGLWPNMHHHGVDVRRFAKSPVLDGVPDDDVDAFLSILVGYLLCDLDAPPPPGCTPALRRHQLLIAGATTGLLAQRRGWVQRAAG